MNRIVGEQQNTMHMKKDMKSIAEMKIKKSRISNLSSEDDESESMSLIPSVLPFQ